MKTTIIIIAILLAVITIQLGIFIAVNYVLASKVKSEEIMLEKKNLTMIKVYANETLYAEVSIENGKLDNVLISAETYDFLKRHPLVSRRLSKNIEAIVERGDR